MLFKVEHGKSTFELNPELKAIEEFSKLTDRQMDFVILVTDYRSPFRKLSTPEKRTQAAITAGYKYEKTGKRLDMNGRNAVAGKVPVIEAAIRKYKELQRDEDYETLLSVSAVIAQIRELNNEQNKNVSELDKAVKFTKDLATLMRTKKELEEILEMREDAEIDPQLSGYDEVGDSSSIPLLAQINMGIDNE